MTPLRAQVLPDGFYDIPVATDLDFPIGVTFDELGRMYVAEKAGRVWLYDEEGQRSPEPFIDISQEVAHFDEHGLNYFLLDNNFLENGYCYLYYALDRHHFDKFGTPEYDPNYSITHDATIGRITRYTANLSLASPQIDYNSRHVLLGRDYADGIPILMSSHGLGSLQQSDDGTLLASCGDGASFLGIDIGSDSLEAWISNALSYGIITEDMDIGAWKSQYLGVLNGKVLRIDSETGDGLPSNPWYLPEAPRHPSSRTWVLGLRNPYRIVLQPLTAGHDPNEGQPGRLLIGDVGGAAWEEINIAEQGGLNFGWPLFEGQWFHWGFLNARTIYNQMAPNPLFGQDGCNQAFFSFKELLINNSPEQDRFGYNPCDPTRMLTAADGFQYDTSPALMWNNRNFNPPTLAAIPIWNEDAGGYPDRITIEDPRSGISGENFTGEASLGGVFYTAENFPPAYHNAYFHMDYSGWLRVFDFDAAGKLVAVRPFATSLRRPVHLALNPADGNLYYVSLEEESIRQIGFGGNPPPVAVVAENQHFGTASLTVQFDASDSYDPNETPISFHWDFGDGSPASTLPAPSHLFQSNSIEPQTFTVVLTVTDEEGATDSQEILVSLNNTPPAVAITSFSDNDRYPTDQTSLLNLEASVADAEHPQETLQYEWQVFFHHNTHFHPETPIENPSAYTFIAPAGCGEETYWYRIRLTVTDPEGLKTIVEHSIFPNCATLPSNWVTLEARESNRKLLLEANTELPGNTQFVELQSSTDFYNFQALSQQDFHPRQQFTFTDEAPYFGTSFYRIRARTSEGDFFYSIPLPVQYPAERQHQVFPNPAVGYAGAKIQQLSHAKVTAELFSVEGKQSYFAEFRGEVGEAWEATLNVSQLPAGLYLYRLQNGDQSYSGQLLIAR